MEKKWLRNFKFFTGCLLAFIFLSFAARADNIRTVEVDVEVPVVEGNTAAALQSAQKIAFEKAVDMVWPASTDANQRAKALKSADRYVKSFRVVQESQEGQTMKLKYRCDVMLPEALPEVAANVPQGGVPLVNTQDYEISWAATAKPLAISEVMTLVETSVAAIPASMRLGRNFIVVSMPTSISGFQSRMSEVLGSRANIRRVDRPLEQQPSEAPPALLNP